VEVNRPIVPDSLLEPLPDEKSDADDPATRAVEDVVIALQQNDRYAADRAVVFCLHRAAAAGIDPECDAPG